MAKKTRDILLHEERERCLALVENYREHLERVVAEGRARKDYTKLVDVLYVGEKVIRTLRRIEDDIKYPSKTKGADFSMEEIELAEKIMAEQNKNPFEAET